MSSVTIRSADPQRDAAACAAIYAPSVEAGVTSFEKRAPDAAEMAERIAGVSQTHAWLVAEENGEVLGYAYACLFQQRPVYRWNGWKRGAWRDVGWWQLELVPAGDGVPAELRPPGPAPPIG